MLSAIDAALWVKHTAVRSAVATIGDFGALNSATAREEIPAAIFIGSLSMMKRRRRKKRRKRSRRRKSLMKMTNWTRRKLTLNKK